MAKEHVEEVQEGATGAGVPLTQTHSPSCPFVPRKEGTAAQLDPGGGAPGRLCTISVPN